MAWKCISTNFLLLEPTEKRDFDRSSTSTTQQDDVGDEMGEAEEKDDEKGDAPENHSTKDQGQKSTPRSMPAKISNWYMS